MAVPVAVAEEIQKILENFFIEDLKFSPEQVRQWFTSNVVQRSLAHLVGWCVDKAVMLQATPMGELKVAVVGAGYTWNEVEAGTTTGKATALTKTFDEMCSRLDVLVETNAIDVEISADGVNYAEKFKLPVGAFSFDCVTKSVKLYDNVDGNHGLVQIVGWR